jgi:glucan phosphoethanolaminetransferase (alkaline phosphatase superfamily)
MDKTLKEKILYSIKIAFILTVVFIVIEQIYRIYSPSLTHNLNVKLIAEYFIMNILLISLKSVRAIKIIYSISILFVFFQYTHINFYGSWIFPLEYILFFTQFSEVLNTFTGVIWIIIIPLLLSLFLFISVLKILSSLKDNRLQIPYLRFILIAYVVYMPINIYVKQNDRGAKPDMERNTIRNTIWTLGFLGGRIMPRKLFNDKSNEQKVMPTPELVQKNPQVNVIIIMGESLTAYKMSLFGYEKETTPLLNKLKGLDNFLYKKAFASGILTDVAIPSFFNVLHRPDSMNQILSHNTCLFKMAKDNGFNTYFYSTQSRSDLSGIKSFLCPNWIDDIKDGTEITKKLHSSAMDGNMLNRLDTIDLSKPNFIVLHQRGSHSPITGQYPKEFEKFQQSKDKPKYLNYLAKYENSVLYTDYLIDSVIKKVKEKSPLETYVIYTSDHGTSVGHRGINGHGSIYNSEQYTVPFIMYSHNGKNIKDDLKDKEFTSHYKIAKIVGNLLGYDFNKILYKKDSYFVCGRDIQGFDGFLKLEVKENEIKSTIYK